MKTWDDVSAELQLNGTPLSALGYCKIAFDAGRESGVKLAMDVNTKNLVPGTSAIINRILKESV